MTLAVHVIFFHHITGNRFGSRRSEEWGYVIHVLWKKTNLFETKKKKRLFTASYMYLNLTFFKCQSAKFKASIPVLNQNVYLRWRTVR